MCKKIASFSLYKRQLFYLCLTISQSTDPSQSNTIHDTGFSSPRHTRDHPSTLPFDAYASIPRSLEQREPRNKVSVDRWATIQPALTYYATRTLRRQDARRR